MTIHLSYEAQLMLGMLIGWPIGWWLAYLVTEWQERRAFRRWLRSRGGHQ